MFTGGADGGGVAPLPRRTIPDTGASVTDVTDEPSALVYVPPREKVWDEVALGLTSAVPPVQSRRQPAPKLPLDDPGRPAADGSACQHGHQPIAVALRYFSSPVPHAPGPTARKAARKVARWCWAKMAQSICVMAR